MRDWAFYFGNLLLQTMNRIFIVFRVVHHAGIIGSGEGVF